MLRICPRLMVVMRAALHSAAVATPSITGGLGAQRRWITVSAAKAGAAAVRTAASPSKGNVRFVMDFLPVGPGTPPRANDFGFRLGCTTGLAVHREDRREDRDRLHPCLSISSGIFRKPENSPPA